MRGGIRDHGDTLATLQARMARRTTVCLTSGTNWRLHHRLRRRSGAGSIDHGGIRLQLHVVFVNVLRALDDSCALRKNFDVTRLESESG